MAGRFRLGPLTGPEEGPYDSLVIGAGPAGLTASLYLARFGAKVLLITKDIGGQMAVAPLVDDYPGIPETPGNKLAQLFEEHVRRFGVGIIVGDPVTGLRRVSELWCVTTASGKEFCGYTVIVAVGTERRRLRVPGEERLLGRGVSYCAVCDGPFFRGKVVAVVGGGNTALVSALYLASIAKSVYVVHRRGEFRAFAHYVKAVAEDPRIEVLLNAEITEIVGEKRVEGIKVRDVVSGAERFLEVDGVFVEIGSEPPRELLARMGLELDEEGYVIVRPDMSTNLPGVFAAGSVTGGPYKFRFEQIITAAAEGAVAAYSAYQYITKVKRFAVSQ